MGRFLALRFLQAIITILLVTMFIFVLMRLLPGDPVRNLVSGGDNSLTPEQIAAREHELGLDKSWPEQYVRWLGGVVSGDWGRSASGSAKITDQIKERLPVTLQLALLTWVVTVAAAIPIGVISALKRNSWLDVSITTGALAGLAAPNFVVALLLIIFFTLELHWLPARGYVSLLDNPVDSLRHFALPVITLATAGIAGIARQTRSAMLEVMKEDFIRTAKSKGLSSGTIIVRHALKNALLPIVTIMGLRFGTLVSGSIIIETVFGIPGMGSLTITAVRQSDYNTIQILVVIFAIMTICGNLLADFTYTRMDPRIRLT
ncbi:MAG: ABC transporter permease [Dehalococcoidia bacterium]